MRPIRHVEPEWLDSLPADDPRAMASRRDLLRINGMMGHARLVRDCLTCAFQSKKPARIVEIGAGDGRFLLSVARQLSPSWPRLRAELIDLMPVVGQETVDGFGKLGWDLDVRKMDVFEWSRQAGSVDLVVANLFLHHFKETPLEDLLRQVSRRTKVFVAFEPRRSRVALGASHLLGWIGCNDVTRHDAVVSVRAGFCGHELSQLWPRDEAWCLEESPAGLFSHGFLATRQ